MDKKKQKKNNKGMTLVEMIVSFALLGIFLAAAGIAISGPVKTYYYQRKTMSAYTVADAVLSEIRNDIQTMRSGITSSTDGYIKIRDENGKALTSTEASDSSGSSKKGVCLEFTGTNSDGTSYAEQIDTAGFEKGFFLTEDDSQLKEPVKKSDGSSKIPKGYLTNRYYSLYPDEKSLSYASLYFDFISESKDKNTASADFSKYAGNYVSQSANQKLPEEFYQGFTISLRFILSNATDPVQYVEVTAEVLNNDGSIEYSKTSCISLQNTVSYKESSTLYSDGPVKSDSDGKLLIRTANKTFEFPYETNIKKNADGSYHYNQGIFYEYKDNLYYASKTYDSHNQNILDTITDNYNMIRIANTEKSGTIYTIGSENVILPSSFKHWGSGSNYNGESNTNEYSYATAYNWNGMGRGVFFLYKNHLITIITPSGYLKISDLADAYNNVNQTFLYDMTPD
ncbi:MAG: type II secretion system GspH family protein [Lachnospiraceae bacterium]|nr:type II secretion system GspH family protein [Lachnospiraceae bacterium]